MGKRFGRNQRRRMRQQLAETGEQVAGLVFHNRSLAAMLDEKRRNLEFISEAILLSNEFSSLLPPRHIQTKDFDAHRREYVQQSPPLSGPCDTISMQPLSIADMAMVAGSVADDPQRYAYHMHLFLEGAGPLDGHWRYSVERRTLEHSGIHMRVLDEIAHRLARQLVTQFVRDIGRARRG